MMDRLFLFDFLVAIPYREWRMENVVSSLHV